MLESNAEFYIVIREPIKLRETCGILEYKSEQGDVICSGEIL